MSDRPATDAEVAALAKSIAILKPEHEIDLNVGFVLSLIARIEADGERMREMERALRGVCLNCEHRQILVAAAPPCLHPCEILDALAALKEAPDA